MKISHVKLVNVGVFRSKSFDFDSDLISISGPNGSGKSTLVNAIYAALTNDFSRFGSTKASVINNTSESDPAYIMLAGTHAGQEFSLVRGLRPGRNEFTWGTEKYTKAGDVDSAVQSLLGISKTVIDKYVFVPQWGMTEFVNQTPSERARLFQHLCGVEAASEVHKACVGFLSRHRMLDTDVSLDAREADVASIRLSLRDAKAEVRNALRSLVPKERIALLRERLAKSEAAKNLRSLMADSRRRVETLSELVAAAKRDAESYAAAERDYQKWFLDHANMRDEATRYARLQPVHQSLVGQLSAAVTELSHLRESSGPPSAAAIERPVDYADEGMKRQLYAEIERANIAIGMFDSLPSQVTSAVCPTCRQPVSASHVESLRVAAEQAQVAKEILADRLTRSQTFDREVSRRASLESAFVAKESHLESVIERLETQEASCRAELEAVKIDNSEEFLRTFSTAERNFRDIQTRRNASETNITIFESQLESAVASLRSYDAVVDDELDEETAASHRQSIVDYEAAYGRYHRARINHGAFAVSLRGAIRRLDEAYATQRRIERRNERIGVVERVANALHWDRLPRMIAQRNFCVLIGDVNRNLEDFQAAFRVQAADYLSFTVHFPDRNPLEATQLSGGQQVILSLAFRLSLDSIFGNSVGLLCFDEPSAGLDVRNQQIFYEALRTIVNRTLDPRQVVVVSHTTGLGQFFDRRIELSDAMDSLSETGS